MAKSEKFITTDEAKRNRINKLSNLVKDIYDFLLINKDEFEKDFNLTESFLKYTETVKQKIDVDIFFGKLIKLKKLELIESDIFNLSKGIKIFS